MDSFVEVRRSNRSFIKPIEFWNFEKPDYSKHERINYSLTLSRLSESNISVATGNKSEVDASKNSRRNTSKNAPKNFSTNIVKRHNSSNAVSKKPRNASSRTNTVKRLNKSEGISKNSNSRADTIKRLNKSNDVSKNFSSKNSSTTRLRKVDTSNKEVESNGEPQSETVPVESGSTRCTNPLLKISAAEKDGSKSAKNGVDERVTSGEEERNADLLTDNSKNDENTEKILSSVATEDSYAQVRKSSEGNGFKLPVIPKQNLKFRKGFSFQQSLCAIPEDTVLETTDATCNATERSTVQQQKENEVFSKNDESAGQKEKKRCHEVSSNLTMSTIYDYSSLSVANESRGVTRHSSRARTKPLEFWNFERTNITTVDDQVNISIVKPNSPPEGKRKRSDMEPKILLQDKKSKKFKGSLKSSMQSPEKEDDTTSSTSGRCDWIPEKLIKFADLNFVEIKSADVNFYIARSYMEPALNLYAGFLFIAKGTLIWDVTQRTVVCVAHGRGILKTAETKDKGTKTILTNGSQIVIPKDCKATIIKDKRFKMLKLFIVLQN